MKKMSTNLTIDNSQACCVFTASRCNRKVTQVDIIHVWGAPGCGTFCHKQNVHDVLFCHRQWYTLMSPELKCDGSITS